MPTQLQIRRGSTSDHTSFTGAAGELTVNTTKDTVLVHDGSTAGGFELARADGSNLNAITNDITFTDNSKAIFGTGDLQIYHNGSNSFINDTGTGSLYVRASDALRIQTATNEEMLKAEANGAVTAYYNNTARLATTSTGIDVTGTATMDGLGVGTDSPAEALHVAGNIRIGVTGAAELYTNTAELRLGVDRNNDNNVASDITFYADGSEKVRMDKDGHLIVPNGVTLGVAVDAYAASNTLDDYEEGTFTPVIADDNTGGNTGTATTLDGSYTKVGRKVTVTFRAVDIDTTGMNAALALRIRNLPFVSGTGVKGIAEGSARFDSVNLNDSACNITCSVGSASSVITFRQTIDSANDSQILVGAYTSGSADILATITYFTN